MLLNYIEGVVVKPNVEFDNIKFEEAKIKKTKQKGLFD
jgi:hypothetical protein